MLGLTLSQLLLGVASRNLRERDGRRKTIIPVAAGNRSPVEIEAGWTVGLDLTSALVLARLDLLGAALDALGGVALAPDTMVVLLNDRRTARFHQPSLVREAEGVRALMDSGRLRTVDLPLPDPPAWLVGGVGDELAGLLAAARAGGGVVVRPSPIHKAGSLMEEPAAFREYRDVAMSALAFVKLLHREGELDQAALARAEARLRALGDGDLSGGGPRGGLAGKAIYLDGLAVTYLGLSGVLAKVGAAGLDLRVHPNLRDEQAAIVGAHQEGEALAREIDGVRSALRAAWLGGRAVFLPRASRTGDGRLREALGDASTLLAFLRHLGPCEAVSCDDRMVNRNPTVSDRGGRQVRTVCVLDVLRFLRRQGRISEDDRLAALHGLRSGGFAFVPVEADEIETRLRAAPAREGEPLVESGELRAIRQNLARLGSLGAIDLATEGGYVDHLSLAAVDAVCRLWRDGTVPVARARACTDWAWRHTANGFATWAASPGGHEVERKIRDAFVGRLALWLQPMPGVAEDRHAAFRAWLDREVLWPLRARNADLLDRLADRIGQGIEQWVEGMDEDEQGAGG